jgi:putative Mg2+ transporter-C (MgtC) family protein
MHASSQLMFINPSWFDISLRLFCALVSAAVFGMDRSGRGRAGGLRTSILVCLAACLAMLQVNLFLSLTGRSPDSFVMNDPMRLPLGILSGIGFIGAGTIVRRGDFVAGVTTAATIWFLTVIGLCYGGGQIILGLVGCLLGLIVLKALKFVEKRMHQNRHGTLRLLVVDGPEMDSNLRALLQDGGYHVTSFSYSSSRTAETQEFVYGLKWRELPAQEKLPSLVGRLKALSGITTIKVLKRE